MSCFKLLLISAFIVANSTALLAQCEVEISHESKPTTANERSGAIVLNFKKSDGYSYEFVLYKIDRKVEKIEDKRGDEGGIIEFKNLRKGDYVVKILAANGCTKMLGGIQGIVVNEVEK